MFWGLMLVVLLLVSVLFPLLILAADIVNDLRHIWCPEERSDLRRQLVIVSVASVAYLVSAVFVAFVATSQY